MSDRKLKLTFCGGTGSVTGANFLLEGEGKKFLIDCGLTQDVKLADDTNWDPFPYNASEIDILFVTHAHIDHIGRIPKLIHDGFRGKIISTPPTKDIAYFMLEDTVHILGKADNEAVRDMYTMENVKKALASWETIDYHKHFKVDEFDFFYQDSGHILGSGMLNILFNGKRIVFTGDLGNSPSPLLPDTERVTDADYLIMESVYGDRNHEDKASRKDKLAEVIQDNYKAHATLIMPTFSLERSQELIFEINDLILHERIPHMPIYLDSPLAIKLMVVYEKYFKYFNQNAQNQLKTGEDIFAFPELKLTLETDESKDILHAPNPKIIIAGSGMSNGGRIIHHEQNYLPDEKNTILLTGYQTMGTIGRRIQNGEKTVRINGQEVVVRAHVAMIDGYSGHKDSDNLLNFVADMQDKVKKIFVVMGEPKSSFFFVQKLRDTLGLNAVAPEQGESVVLDC